MNEIKKCSISGIAFILETEAYNRINDYIHSLKRAYKDNPDSSEIIADIEARIAELILSAQRNPDQVVCLPLIENIIKQLGSAEDISDSEQSDSEPTTKTRIARRLYRDLENSKLGGVCAGIGKYFNIDPVWVRLAIFAPLIFVPISGISHYVYWLNNFGQNLFGVLLVVYLILWFVIPEAKSARQKLEMEGEAITAKSIADKQQVVTDEQRAKSNLASFVAGLGKLAMICLKAFVVLMLFSLVMASVGLIIALFASLTGLGASLIHAGNLGTLADAISTFGVGLPILAIAIVLVPIVTIIYLLTVLLIGRRPKLWVLISALVIWILLILGIITTATSVVSYMHDDEIERILKSDWDEARITEPLDSLEYNKLLNDPNAESID